jgi:tRNA-splicing ligase RtcB
VGVHFGSRGLGHKTATHFLRAAGGKDGMDVPPTVVSEASEIGTDYLAAMELAGRYAYAGREAVARHVVRGILRANALEEVHNHHNFAWREKHGAERYWVVRKGATPAFPGQRGFIGGSMGDDAVIIEGIDSPVSREALYSTVHGAGRIMSRTAAKGRFEKVNGRRVRREGLVRHDDMRKWIADKASSCGAAMWTKRRRRIVACRMCSPRTKGRSGSCIRCVRSASRWPARTSSIPTRIDDAFLQPARDSPAPLV